ncbi:hypothetical protein LINGRAHAP2_LOCUS32781, partial [Linum grandiflorum]
VYIRVSDSESRIGLLLWICCFSPSPLPSILPKDRTRRRRRRRSVLVRRMVDEDKERVCCMCGDVGFAEKLFRCVNCRHRFQHSYCSNYYNSRQSSEPTEQCDWCQSEEIKNGGRAASRKSFSGGSGSSTRSEYSGHKIKHEDIISTERQSAAAAGVVGRNHGGLPSPKTRRYKLLKDVMC